jgi:hypothetical protein
MRRKKISTAFDDHDYEQIELLASMNKMTLPEMVRKICRVYLDGGKVPHRDGSARYESSKRTA